MIEGTMRGSLLQAYVQATRDGQEKLVQHAESGAVFAVKKIDASVHYYVKEEGVLEKPENVLNVFTAGLPRS